MKPGALRGPTKNNDMEKQKRLATILGGISIFLLFAGCVEGHDGGVTLWNLIAMAGAFAFGYLSKWLDDHIEITKK